MKAVLAGACMAAVSGLLMGSALKPDLRADDRAEGPQIIAGMAGEHAASGPFDDDATYGLAAYHGTPPDYVFGTDARRAETWPAPNAEPPPEATPRVEDAADGAPPADEARFTRADYSDGDDTPTPVVSYPSLDGGASRAAADLIPPASDEDVGG